MMTGMNTDALLTFLTIYRTGGFSSAALKLHRSQPAISRRIAQLEAELGAPVFERGSSGITLSQVGEALVPHAERVLAALEDANGAIRSLRAPDSGPVSLAAVGTLAGPQLTGILRRFADGAPNVTLSLRTATSAQVSELVRRGEVTLGIRYFEDRSPDLECLPMVPEMLVVACSPGHPLAGRKVARLTDLAGESWLAFPRLDPQGEVVAESLHAQFLVRHVAEIRWTAVDSLTAQKRLAEAGFGIVLVPESGILEELKTGSLAMIAVGDLDAFNPVNAIRRKGGFLSGAAQALLALLIEQ